MRIRLAKKCACGPPQRMRRPAQVPYLSAVPDGFREPPIGRVSFRDSEIAMFAGTAVKRGSEASASAMKPSH